MEVLEDQQSDDYTSMSDRVSQTGTQEAEINDNRSILRSEGPYVSCLSQNIKQDDHWSYLRDIRETPCDATQ